MCGTEQVLFAQLQLLVTSWQAGRSSSPRRRSSRRGEKGAERRFAAVLASICTTTNANKQAIRYVEIVALT